MKPCGMWGNVGTAECGVSGMSRRDKRFQPHMQRSGMWGNVGSMERLPISSIDFMWG
ncbi:hypothetical protein Barb4_01067 [Bacteroidales bacterium Barb4]|nr:hypothetical protein Barb4_01067 [Bacteroidales bacterium Barb4]